MTSAEIKDRLDVVDVVSGYVPELRRSGRNFVAPCPFHAERTPSFVVFPDRGSWRCFGACATGGDVFAFVMRIEGLSFPDALKLMAERVGLSLPVVKNNPPRSDLYRVNQAAASFYQDILKSQRGIAARSYVGQRGLDDDTLRAFQIGLSPGTGNDLLRHLESLGYTISQICDAGLAVARENRPERDMFVSRLMFPIHNSQGDLVGFGGRSLDGSEPKYLNTPRTEIFDKRNILYAFHKAKTNIREHDEGVVVEGYMDAIAAHQYGFENVVASMGTALTEQQVALLKGSAKRFVMALDADAAGQAATFRSLRESWQALKGRSDITLRILALPFGKDPDEVIRSSPEAWGRGIAEATIILDYLFDSARDFWDLATSQGKQQAAEELKELIDSMPNVFEQDTYYRRLSEILEVPMDTLEAAVGRPTKVSNVPARKERRNLDNSSRVFESRTRDVLEEHTLAILLRWPELRSHVRQLDAECFGGWEARQIFTALGESTTIDALIEQLDENLRQQAEYLLSLSIPPMNLRQREQAISDCYQRLEERWLRNLKLEEASHLAESSAGEYSAQTWEEISVHGNVTNERLKQLFKARSEHDQSGYQR